MTGKLSRLDFELLLIDPLGPWSQFERWFCEMEFVNELRRKLRRAEKTTKEEVQAKIQSVDDELLSIRTLMTKQESNVIISDPREYQTELFERAKNENIIAVLDTGMCGLLR